MKTLMLRAGWLVAILGSHVVSSPGTLCGQVREDGPSVDLDGESLPAGAVARLGSARFRFPGGNRVVQGLKFTPDSSALVLATEGSILFMDVATGRVTRAVKTDPYWIRGFALSADGRMIAVAGYAIPDHDAAAVASARILDVATGEVIRTLARSDRDIDRHELAFTPDGKLLVSLGTGGIVRIEEVASGTELLTQRFDGDNSPSMELSPDGSTVVLTPGPNRRKAFLWSWHSGEAPRELPMFGKRTGNAEFAFAPDGRTFAVCGVSIGGPQQIWDVAAGRALRDLKLPDESTYVRGAPLYLDGGKTVAARAYRRDRSDPVGIHLWSAETGEHIRLLATNSAGALAASGDGRLLAAAYDADVTIWKWPSGEEVSAGNDGHRMAMNQIVAGRDGTVVTASDDGTIRIWDLATSSQKLRLEHDKWVRAIELSPNGGQIASSSLDESVRLWDAKSGREIFRLAGHGRTGGTRAVQFSPDGRQFASFGDDCYLRVWDVATGKSIQEHKIRPTGVKVPGDGAKGDAFDFFHIDRARFAPDMSVLALSLGKHFVFDVQSGRELLVIENPGSHVTSLAISPDGRYLLGSAWGKSVETKLPDGRTRYSSARNNLLALWELASGKEVKQIVLADGGAGPVAFSPDGSRFAAATSKPKEKITVFDIGGKELRSIENVPSRVSALAFGADGRTLVAGLADTTALVWDVAGAAK